MPERATEPPTDSLAAEDAIPWESDEVLTEADIAKARRVARFLFPEDDDYAE